MIVTQPPRRLQRDIAVQQIGSETLVYDEIRHQAFCLNRTSGIIWKLCNGIRTEAAIAEAATLELQAPVSEELVQYAVAELLRDGLLEPTSVAALPPDVSRRTLMRTFGAGAVAMLPLVAAIMTPTAAQAYNGCADCAALTPAQKQKRTVLNNAQKKAQQDETDPFRLHSNE
jgi:hypothetical protein